MSVRLNITMDDDVYARLKKEVPPKKLSALYRRGGSRQTSSRCQSVERRLPSCQQRAMEGNLRRGLEAH